MIEAYKVKIDTGKCFVIDPDTTFLYFSKVVMAKLNYINGVNEALFFFTGTNRLQITTFGKSILKIGMQMGDIYDKFKS